MFQDALLFEHMTVAENIAFAMPKDSHQIERLKWRLSKKCLALSTWQA